MIPLQNFSSGVLAQVVRRQPSSPARTNFAWQLAVGPVLARATTVELADGVLHVRSRDPRWLKEIRALRQQVLLRLQHLLGPEVKTLKLESDT
ncbi:MAG TPA: DciA family protein [Vicinamibacterales bacterium]